jgi:glutamine synthetase
MHHSTVIPARKVHCVPSTTAKTETPEKPLRVSEYFGELTFGLKQLRESLSSDHYQKVLHTLNRGEKIDREVADLIAQVAKEWAISNGATHYCHWFQPMTGLTAAKHDAFISIRHSHLSETRVIETFTGSQLIRGEPDASSFPNGGMRSTFEARGYTAWDPDSPLFILEGPGTKTLCIPSVFIGYHGQALDNKVPLLRSAEALSHTACEFLKLIGDLDVKSVTASLGVEQEYFLIDAQLAQARPDLIMTGRTLIGAPSPRGQQLEDHYFGAIPTRALAFMAEVEYELYRLGIPVKTRHNEVAPGQFEFAPIYEQANIASDHNLLTIEVLKKVAQKHGFMCLLHEKPFAGVNGSGKHCNWSIQNDKGENLLDPGTTPHQNLRFLIILAVVLKAVHKHAGMLRASIASAGNDHRLGGHEAPPAIMSVFLGSMLNTIVENIEASRISQATPTEIINLGVNHLPDITKDYTDRNRTSPFAFTGNKFEFRAVGSSANPAVPTTYLNAAVADIFADASLRLRKLIENKVNRDDAVLMVLKELLSESRAIRFEGNNYSKEWHGEAKKRNLPILKTSRDAFTMFKSAETTQFLVEQKVFSVEEIKARYHIAIERYTKQWIIEMATLEELVKTMVIPCVEEHLCSMAAAHATLTIEASKQLHAVTKHQLEQTLATLLEECSKLATIIDEIKHTESYERALELIGDTAQPCVVAIRSASDTAEKLVKDATWPLPKYRELLFSAQ